MQAIGPDPAEKSLAAVADRIEAEWYDHPKPSPYVKPEPSQKEEQ